MKRIKSVFALCLALVLALPLAGCFGKPDKIEPKGKSYFTYFDTVSYVFDYSGDSAERFDDRSAEVSGILEEYHQLLDIYHEYSGINNLCTINRLAGGEPVSVDEKLIRFLSYAKDLYTLTGGEMNVMMGAVLRLWHDCRTAASDDPSVACVPSEQELAEAARHTDISLLEIDSENLTVRITDPLSSIDVGALGKGYATERAADYLFSQEAYGYVLNVGGNIRIIGTKPDGSGWITGIKDPNDPDGNFALSLLLSDTACVTSGIYERYFTVDGVRYHHIIDKDTLYPADYFSSLTVITADSGLADCLSTALFCMSQEDGQKLIDKIGGVEVLWIYPDGSMAFTEGLSGLITD